MEKEGEGEERRDLHYKEQMEEQKGRKWKGNRNGNKKDTKGKLETNVISFQNLGQVFQTALSPWRLSPWSFVSLIPCMSPRRSKNSPRQRMWRFGLVCQEAWLLPPSLAVQGIPPGRKRGGIGESRLHQVGSLMGREQEKLADEVEGWRRLHVPWSPQTGDGTAHRRLPGWLRRGQRNFKLLPCTSCSVYESQFPSYTGSLWGGLSQRNM